MKRVVVSIKGGKVSADFQGFQGRTCEDLEKRIRPDGTEVNGVETKPEYDFATSAATVETVIY
ncbi:hypothetical protein [Pseudomonas sp. LS-2]|uniref:hypothetical protein n=1 Tax=Pseudomonas sp. LS-2 TaxID=2315859 RepID=UPI000E72DD0B|nr:hypothetical protein [Pseudomonas sp. LS-2]RJX82291.1 hypothetical protein D3M70_06885 [Pseudomonas sp. LS-2]